MAETASEPMATFDIIDGIILETDMDLLENLTDEEKLEVENVVTLLDATKEDSLEHFDLDEETVSAIRHKQVSESELDHLAAKNCTFNELPN